MTESFIQEHYDSHYQKTGFDTLRIEWVPVIKNLSAKSTVLDIGCGDGNLGKILIDKLGVSIDGVEASKEAGNIAKERGYKQVVITDINNSKLPFCDNSYDYTLLIDVVEHVFKPMDVLKEAIRIAKKGVFVATPNIGCWFCRGELLLGHYPRSVLFGEPWYESGHIRLSTYKELTSEVKKMGYSLATVNSIMPISSNKYLTTFEQESIPRWLKFCNYLYRPFIKMSPNFFSLIYVVEVKK